MASKRDLRQGSRLQRQADLAVDGDDLETAMKAACGRLPPRVRRQLAMTLLERGRVEAAGREFSRLLAEVPSNHPAWATRADCRAAIVAFEHAPGPEMDAGPPTPHRVLAQAEALAEAGNAADGATLLAAHRADWGDVPPAYIAALQRLRAAGELPEAKLARLRAAHYACTGAVPASLSLALGTALLEAGHAEAAGEALDRAAAAGAAVDRLDFRVAIDLFRRKNGIPAGYETRFSRDATLVDTEKRLVYVPILKNACTQLKTSFVLNSRHRAEFLASRLPIHVFCANLMAALAPVETILAPDHFRFVVLRDPFRRLLSAYLDKVVRTWRNQHTYLRFNLLQETIAGAQRLAGVPYDPLRSISFEEFVHYLADADDTACNLHWLPQYRFAGRDLGIYHHVGKVERLADTHALLADRFGYRTETWPEVPRPSPRRHTTRYSPDARLAAPHLALPRELDAHEDSLPEPDRFYTPTLRQMVAKRFAEDVALYDAIDSLP